jgi:hypothetical protein
MADSALAPTVERIGAPRLVASERRYPDRIMLGDTVTLEDGPELHQHLSQKVPGQSHGVGTAIHPGTTVPLGLAIDAAILSINGKRLGISILRYCSFTMESRASINQPLRATARVVELGARHVECVSDVWQEDRLICKARIGLCRSQEGRAIPLTSYYLLDGAESQAQPR